MDGRIFSFLFAVGGFFFSPTAEKVAGVGGHLMLRVLPHLELWQEALRLLHVAAHAW